MADIEECVEELSQRIKQLSDKTLSYRVTADTLVDDRLSVVYSELNGQSCLWRNWKGLAGKLLKPRPTFATIENLSQSANAARELLITWVSQQSHQNQASTFEMLIETMLKCKLYSACDELLDFLEKFEKEPVEIVWLYEIVDPPQVIAIDDVDDVCEDERTTASILEWPDNAFDEIVRRDVPELFDESSKPQENNCSAIVVSDDREQQQQEQPQSPALEYRQDQQVVDAGSRQRPNRRRPPSRSVSCPASLGGWIVKKIRRLFHRSRSDPGRSEPSPPPIIRQPPTPVLEDEIFVVSSDPDYRTKAMQDLLSCISRMKPVLDQVLTVKTIHDVDQNGFVTPIWLEERVKRARFVILCFSNFMKTITEAQSDAQPDNNRQINYNIKFTMEFLVTGKIYESLCRNPKGKFVPVLLHGDNMNTIIIPLRYFKFFSWPEEKKQFSNYLNELPERPIPKIGTPKPLVRKELTA